MSISIKWSSGNIVVEFVVSCGVFLLGFSLGILIPPNCPKTFSWTQFMYSVPPQGAVQNIYNNSKMHNSNRYVSMEASKFEFPSWPSTLATKEKREETSSSEEVGWVAICLNGLRFERTGQRHMQTQKGWSRCSFSCKKIKKNNVVHVNTIIAGLF